MNSYERDLMSEALTIVRAHQAHIGASHPGRYELVKEIGDRMDAATKASPSEAVGRDAERLNWLSHKSRWVQPWEEDAQNSAYEFRKQVHHYISGRYTITKGNSLREAIDAAMQSSRSDRSE